MICLKRLNIGILFALEAVSNLVWGAEAQTDFAASAPIHADGGDALYRVALPKDVYRSVTDPNLADLRVFNGAGEIVPHAFIPRGPAVLGTTPTSKLGIFPIPVPPHNDRDGKSVRVETDSKGAVVRVDVAPQAQSTVSPSANTSAYLIDATTLSMPIRALILDIESPADYLAQTQLEASDDLTSWRKVAGNAPIMALTQDGQRLERRRIEFVASSSKYFRLVWDDMPASAKLVGVEAEAAQVRSEIQHEWEPVSGTLPEHSAGQYQFDSHGHFPTDEVRLDLPQSNTVASVQIFSRASASGPWRPVARDTVYRLNRKGRELISPPIIIPGDADRYWLVQVDQRGGGVGAGSPVLLLGWIPEEIAFAARGSPPFVLAFGQWGTPQAALDINALVPGYRLETASQDANKADPLLVRATLGPVTVATQLADQPEGENRKTIQTILLWALLGGGVALVGWMTWRLSHQMRSATHSSETEETIAK